MKSLQEIKAEFVQIYEDMLRAKGLPTIFGRIMATLLLEGRELSHKEISNLTGYSISSVSRTLDQMVRMGIVHKHKDVSEAQREEMKRLEREVRSLKSKEKAEVNRLLATLDKVEKTIEFAEGIMRNTIRELRTP